MNETLAQELRDICNGPPKTQCSVCFAIRSTDGTWIPYPERLNNASHTYCTTHYAEERLKLEAYKAQKMAASVA